MSGLFDADDADDPWTFFGQFNKTEIEGASRILAEASIVFEVKEADWDKESGWSGPYCLWVRDESIGLAKSLLNPFFGFKDSN